MSTANAVTSNDSRAIPFPKGIRPGQASPFEKRPERATVAREVAP